MRFILLLSLTLLSVITFGQKLKNLPETRLQKNELESHLRFLASDEMLGRKTGDITNRVAARYIAEKFREFGLKTANQTDYLQQVSLVKTTPSKIGKLMIESDTLNYTKDFIVLEGQETELNRVPVVFVGYGWVDSKHDDYKDIDVKGKIVIAQFGIPDSDDPSDNISGSTKKASFAAERGALALVQLYNLKFPWTAIVSYVGGEKISLETPNSSTIPHIWVNGSHIKKFSRETLQTLSMKVGQVKKTPIFSSNVVGVLEGSDSKLKNEYLVLSAHFDHVGVGKSSVANDSIFNGARDNALGTTALLAAAKVFSNLKTKRSLLFVAYTGEEVGMLGSKFYAEHPLIPLNQCVFNLNTDGAGYNDTTKVTVIGLDRTDAQTQIVEGSKVFGLTAISDPAPEQNLFDRSDNVSLAAKGIPAPDYSPGFTAFDNEINKFYHKVTDSPESVNMNYLLKFCQAYTYVARLIADRDSAPKWKSGDKYEEAFNKLYAK